MLILQTGITKNGIAAIKKINRNKRTGDVYAGNRSEGVCIGTAASMGAVLFAAGDRRDILPHGRVMIHDPLISGGGNRER